MIPTHTPPAYTPYDGSSKPFSIGLTPIDLNDWIEPDGDLATFLAEKKALEKTHFDNIFLAAPESLDAQRETLALLTEHVTTRHAGIYSRRGDIVEMAGHSVDLSDETRPPLLRAGSLVQDDLLILRRKEDGWTLVAAHLAFPSSWSLPEKFMKPMDQIHAGVPGFQGGTRNATLINRMFDKLDVNQPVKRYNWSVNWRYALYHPRPEKTAIEPNSPGVAAANAIIRIERQVLRRLPQTGDLLFTVRIYLDPLKAITEAPDGARLAASMAAQLEALEEDQINYKGLAEKRRELVDCLLDVARQKVASEA